MSTVGLKAAAALSGVVLWGWLALHLAGNLLMFAGPAATDHYAALLHGKGALLWLARTILLAGAGTHTPATIALARRARRARPTVARRWAASRTMRVGGVLLLAFVVFHLLHL